MEAGKRSKWMTHVKKTMKAHKGVPLSKVLKMAKKTYKGGADVQPHSDFGASADIGKVGDAKAPIQDAAPLSGGRRRKSHRKTRRHTRKH